MVLYTCSHGKSFAGPPGPFGHPCAKAAKALDEAGHIYDWKQVSGSRLNFRSWATRAQDRAEVEELSGQRAVPVLVVDAGEVIVGSGPIVRWARDNEPSVPGAGG